MLSVHGNKMAAAVPDITSASEEREGKWVEPPAASQNPFYQKSKNIFTEDAHNSVCSLSLYVMTQIHIQQSTKHLWGS